MLKANLKFFRKFFELDLCPWREFYSISHDNELEAKINLNLFPGYGPLRFNLC